MPDYELTEGDLREVDRVVAARAAHREIESQKATWSNAIVAEVEARERQAAIDAHAKLEAGRFAMEPRPGSVEAIARDWALGQQEMMKTAGPLLRSRMPEAVREAVPPPVPIPAPGPAPAQPEGPRPGSVEAIAAAWKADRSKFGGNPNL